MTDVAARAQADLQIARDALIAILPRISAMNSFVRARRGGTLARIVYHYKHEALEQATHYGLATHRKAQVFTTCRDCGGSGRFHNAWWIHEPLDHCYRCNNSGKVTLEFVESELPGALWLSPRDKSWRFAEYDKLPKTERNWQINQHGVELTPEDVAGHLNAIEAFFLKPPPKEYHEYGESDPHRTYSLYIGSTDHATCDLCGLTPRDTEGGHGIHTGRIEWTAHACKACQAIYAGGVRIFEALKTRMPSKLLTPAVREWVARHPVTTK